MVTERQENSNPPAKTENYTPLDNFTNSLLLCPNDQKVIVTCVKEGITVINSWIKEIERQADQFIVRASQTIKIMIRMAAERLKEVEGIDPHSICSILTKELCGLVPARTIRNALGGVQKCNAFSQCQKSNPSCGRKKENDQCCC